MISLHAVKSVSNTFPFNKGFSRPKSGAQRSAGVKAAAQWKDTLDGTLETIVLDRTCSGDPDVNIMLKMLCIGTD
eukprot:scaffold7554_cov15-Tisochrysis_lutea.AAC.3